MTTKFYCVLDTQQNYKTYVLALVKDGVEEIQYYTLREGESLLETDPPAQSFLKPRWNGEGWEESASQEEIQQWQDQNPPPAPAGPSLEDRVSDLEEAFAAAQYGGERADSPTVHS